MGARTRLGVVPPARLHKLTESIPLNQFPGSLKVWRAGMTSNFIGPARHAMLHRLAESIPGLLKRLQIRARNTISRLNIIVCAQCRKLLADFSANLAELVCRYL
jgi:hypothetical protein